MTLPYAIALPFKTATKEESGEKEASQSHMMTPNMSWLSTHDLLSSVERPSAKICACPSSTLKCTLTTASEQLFYQLMMSPWLMMSLSLSIPQYMWGKTLIKKFNVLL